MTEATETKKPRSARKARKPAAPKVPTSLPNNPLMFEILDMASRTRGTEKKVDVLKRYGCGALKALFIWNFDETVVSALPPGEVPYSGYEEQHVYNGTLTDKIEESSRQMYENGSFSLGSTDANAKTTLRAQWKNLYHFVEGGNGGLSKTRREMMFINLLESVHPLEAEILILVKDKELDTKYKVPFEVVEEAFPEIQWGGR